MLATVKAMKAQASNDVSDFSSLLNDVQKILPGIKINNFGDACKFCGPAENVAIFCLLFRIIVYIYAQLLHHLLAVRSGMYLLNFRMQLEVWLLVTNSWPHWAINGLRKKQS